MTKRIPIRCLTLSWALLVLAGCPGEDREHVPDASSLDAHVEPPDAPPAEAELVMDPLRLDFGDTLVGMRSATLDVRLENRGAVASAAIEMRLEDPTHFRIEADACTGARLDPGDGCDVTVLFAPEREGPLSTSLTARTADFAASLVLEGTGVIEERFLVVTPTPFDYGVRTITEVVSQTFTVVNAGGSSSGVIETSISGLDAAQFTLGVDDCAGVSIAPGASCSIEVSYAPTSTGAHMAALTVSATASAGGSAALLGRGRSSESLPLRPNSADFGRVVVGSTTEIVDFTLTNVSGSATGTISHSFSGTHAADARVVESTCMGVSLAPTESCVIRVRLVPTTPGFETASLDVMEGPRISSAILSVECLAAPP